MGSYLKLSTSLNCSCIFIVFVILLHYTLAHKLPVYDKEEQQQRQFIFGAKTKETNPPNFARLVLMRLVYGLASTMGMEERLEDMFNGAFVPPNADNDVFSLFGGGSSSDAAYDDDDEGEGFAFDYGEFFDDY